MKFLPPPFLSAGLAFGLLVSASSLCAQQPRPVPPGAKALRDLAYVENGHERQKLDLYLPEKAPGPVPVIIWVHGGGWQNGTKDGCPPLRAGYLERGYAVASLGYRLSSHAIFPAQIEDCKAAIRWLRAHAQEHGLDPQRFGVWGSSAGGHLVALLGTTGDVKEFETSPNREVSSRVQAVCDYYGPTDFTQMDAHAAGGRRSHDSPDSPESKLLGGPVQENKDKAARANSVTYVTPDDPPFLIVHGDQDPAVPHHQSELLFEALRKTGVSVHFHTIKGAGHGGPGFDAPEVKDRVARFFDEKLKAGGVKNIGEATTSESQMTATASTPGNRPQRPDGPNRQRPTFDQLLNRADADKDGRLSKTEFRGPAQLFERLDTDRDGFVSKAEHERAMP